MPSATGRPITFLISGRSEPVAGGVRGGARAAGPLPGGLRTGRVKQSVRVAAVRGTQGEVRLTAVPGEDVVVLRISGGPELVLHPETARDLLVAQGAAPRDANDSGTRDDVRLPPRLRWRGLAPAGGDEQAVRGGLGDVLVSALDVVTDLAIGKVAEKTAGAIGRRFDAVVDPGVYALAPDALAPLKGSGARQAHVPAPADGAPLLVLVHGAFSETSGTFSKLWTHHPQLVRTLFERYGGRVFALDHPTLCESPITNALLLAQALPKQARLHLVTHSRGGLVAEVLARAAAQPTAGLDAFAGATHRRERDDLRALLKVITEKRIQIGRVVRVACPARGTLLASKRLDAYLSVFKWTLEMAGVPALPMLVDFLAAVAQQRSDPEQFPGLAAQMPDSPLIQWLHADGSPSTGQLRVIAGDVQGDSLSSWLKTLLTDAFYWTDHDLVVQTRSMYGGVRRTGGASFVFDRGGQVSHFSYFANERTAAAIVRAAVEDTPHGFRPIGPASWAGESATGIRAAPHPRAARATSAGERPAVFLLPAIDGDLAEFLAKTHEVTSFDVDWRRPLEDEARRLADAVDQALDARAKTRQPVRLLAYSFAGLVARTLQLERLKIWQRLLAHPDARIVMLGTPNGGWWMPMRMLSGDDPFGRALAASAPLLHEQAERQALANATGLIELQAAVLDDARGLGNRATWERFAREDLARVEARRWWHRVPAQLDACRWGVPPQRVLDRAVALRRRLDRQRDKDLAGFAERLRLVVGRAPLTPDGYDKSADGLTYLDAVDAGDGRVTYESARLPGVRTWVLDAEHAELPQRDDAHAAYLELLQTGETTRLPLFDPDALPATIARVRSRTSRSSAAAQPSATPTLYATDAPAEKPAATGGPALRVTVVNGDLSFVSQPLLIGHYRSMRLTGTERVMNRLIGGVMEDALRANLYPDRPGTHAVFVNRQVDPGNPWRLPRPEAVVVVGLGDEGSLRSADLVETVRHGAVAWAQRLAERPEGAPIVFALTATLIGSGGSRMTAGQSAQLVAQGVREANRILDDERLTERRWPRVVHLRLIELYLDRAGEAWRALRMQAEASPGDFLVSDIIEIGTGPLARPIESGYRGADYDLISATIEERPGGDTVIAYTVDTRRARTEVRTHATQAALLRSLIAKASNDRSSDAQIGRTLFQLLVPIELEPFLGGTTEMVIELDRGTAGIPWELLDTASGAGRDERPWAIRTKLLRKLRTYEFRPPGSDADADSSVLVIGEPASAHPRLPGARAEARQVVARLTPRDALGADRVTALISPDDPDVPGPDARTILNTLLARNWRIIHLAGHGEPPEVLVPLNATPGAPETYGDPRGVVLSDGYLGPREIRGMRAVPELVFVNCCHLARGTTQTLAVPHDRARFAAGVAEELIRIGVRCVIAAGWAVEDGPACAFATAFYDGLLAGRRFIDAVAEAREVAASYGGNTWAAYQCYGDPDWTFRLGTSDAQRPGTPLFDEFESIASPLGLKMALDTLTVRSRFQGAQAADQQTRLRHLQARFAARWGGMGEVAEAFGAAWTEAADPVRAAEWYERAVAANDGTASIKATEQLGNIRARLAWEAVDRLRRRLAEETSAAASTARPTRGRRARSKKTPAPGRAVLPAARALGDALAPARAAIASAIQLLETTIAVAPTMERESLCGSAFKRLALVEAEAGRAHEERLALEGMKRHYERAEAIGRARGLPGIFYPALNRLAAELVMNVGREGWRGLDRAELATLREALARQVREDPDFWSVAAQAELTVYEAIGTGAVAKQVASIEADFADLQARVSAPWMWASVRDQMQFVLESYGRRASSVEQRAASSLLDRLAVFAGRTAQVSTSAEAKA